MVTLLVCSAKTFSPRPSATPRPLRFKKQVAKKNARNCPADKR